MFETRTACEHDNKTKTVSGCPLSESPTYSRHAAQPPYMLSSANIKGREHEPETEHVNQIPYRFPAILELLVIRNLNL